MEERNYWIGFSVFPGIGPARFQTLLKTFGSAKDAWHASRKEIEKALGPKLAEHFETFRSNFSLEQYTKRVEEKNVWFVTLTDSEYPQLLKQIPNPPFVLYGKGDLDCLYSSSEANAESRSRRSSEEGSRQARTIAPTIAVVGTRKITSYGEQVTRLLTEELVQAGCVVVSGLAMGVDAVAHTTTVESGGKTIAVLGCGVDCCFPATNQNVYDSILESGGCIVSEYPLSASPTKGSFPSRNRIIAGLSQG
ncbi:MAG TPA: DNA-processing protein DprA, partial [Patescibacteria group bacterium]|nr:DNA-processing protein DprA [Patescibacteria group bacterium]